MVEERGVTQEWMPTMNFRWHCKKPDGDGFRDVAGTLQQMFVEVNNNFVISAPKTKWVDVPTVFK
jgi:hypothetical protein